MIIRPANADDQPAVEAVVAAAFGEPADGRVVAMMRALDASEATAASMVAIADGQVVGHVQLNRAWVDARRALVEVLVLVLSPLSVAPDRQGRGIGTGLVAAAITHAQHLQSAAVFLEGSPAYYGRRGFRPAGAVGFVRPSVRIPGPAFQVALLTAHEDWMVGQLVYPEAFWTTDTVGLRDPLLQQIEEAAREVAAQEVAPADRRY